MAIITLCGPIGCVLAPVLPPCGQPPTAANWTISASCRLNAVVIAPRNVIVTNNAALTIPGGIWLNVDFTDFYLRILPGSKVVLEPTARLYTLPLGHTFLNNTDGTFGYYLKRVGGLVMEIYNETFAFYPSSTNKVLEHLHAMRAVDAGTVNLNTTMLNVCPGTNTNCTDNPNTSALCGGSMSMETLGFALGRMMINSDNQDANAIQELFGSGTPSVGRAAMNQTAYDVVGTSIATALQHKFSCGNVSNDPYNTLTLVDIGLIYEQTLTNDAVLPEPTRTTFRQIMFNETNNNAFRNLLNAVIDQEAALIKMPAPNLQAFKNGVQFAHKSGNNSNNYESDAGWVQLPVNGGADTRRYVYGHFVDGASANTLPNIATRSAELLRTSIREALILY